MILAFKSHLYEGFRALSGKGKGDFGTDSGNVKKSRERKCTNLG